MLVKLPDLSNVTCSDLKTVKFLVGCLNSIVHIKESPEYPSSLRVRSCSLTRLSEYMFASCVPTSTPMLPSSSVSYLDIGVTVR